MAHDSNTGRIYIGSTGVEIADVQAVLNLSNKDIGALITQGASLNKINKWAKYKPVRYYTYDTINQRKVPYPGLLTGDMWKGAVLEQTNYNRYYGIQVRVQGVDAQMNTWPLLHNTTFEYFPPRGLSESEFFRLRDFEEYRQNAVANPSASFGSEGSAVGYFNYENGISGISVRYYDPVNGNPYGVDLTGVLMDPNESGTSALQQTYPCIIVGKNNTHYITALGYEDDPNHAPRPVYYNNAYVGGTWVADTSKPVFDQGGHTTTPPWTSAQTGLSATVVLLRTARSGGIYLDALGTQDLAENWFECTTDITTTKAPVPMPGAVGVSLDLIAFENGFYVHPTGVVSSDTSSVTLSFNITYSGVLDHPRGSAIISAHVGNGGDWRDRTMLLIGPNPSTGTVTFYASDFGMDVGFVRHTTYSIEVHTTASPGNNTDSGTFSFTIP